MRPEPVRARSLTASYADCMDAGYASAVPPSPAMRALRVAGWTVLGAMTGLLGSFLQAWPGWGLPVALVLSAAVFVLCGWASAARTGALASGLAWLITVYLLGSTGSGDYVLLGTDTKAQIWSYGGAVLALACSVIDYEAMAQPVEPVDGPPRG